MKYNKLVRDKIPDLLQKIGKHPKSHIANEKEYKEKLYTKLEEEVQEFITTDEKGELADILEVIYALSRLHGLTRKDLEKIRKQKAIEKGYFFKKIILDEAKK